MAARRKRVLERLVAAIIVIGAVLWGASMLASPETDEDADAPQETLDDPGALRDAEAPILNNEDEDEDEEEERGEGKGKRKKGRDGGD